MYVKFEWPFFTTHDNIKYMQTKILPFIHKSLCFKRIYEKHN